MVSYPALFLFEILCSLVCKWVFWITVLGFHIIASTWKKRGTETFIMEGRERKWGLPYFMSLSVASSPSCEILRQQAQRSEAKALLLSLAFSLFAFHHKSTFPYLAVAHFSRPCSHWSVNSKLGHLHWPSHLCSILGFEKFGCGANRTQGKAGTKGLP